MDAFDGLHIGQRKLLDSAYVQARSEGLRLAIITFEAMPASRPDAEQPVRDWQRLTTDCAR